MIRPHRKHPLYLAFVLHRISGLALALFLPVHFYVLSLALTDRDAFSGFIAWTDHLGVKLAEFVLVGLLAVHFFGGLRLLALELTPWTGNQKALAAGAVSASFAVSTLFFLSAV